MKQLTLIALMLISIATQAQANFEKGMSKAFDLWEANKMDEAENVFERIANAEPNEWLPNYYIAQINSLKSWGVKDATVLKAQLDKAQKHLDLAKKKNENNSEILVMQAHVYTNWVAFDGMTYGMKYSAIIPGLYEKAIKLSPNNPRAVIGKAEWGMGSAKYFGKDTAPYCKEIKEAIKLFDTFKPKGEFYPNWGKERAEQVAKSCKA